MTHAAPFAALRRTGDRQVLAIGGGRPFLSRRLTHRLTEFTAKHRGDNLRLHHSPSEFRRRAKAFDIVTALGGEAAGGPR